jgi:spermidine synthase
MSPILERRIREQRARVLMRSFDYRQRHHARGVWFRVRRVLADARAAYVIPENDARTLIAEGHRVEPVGQELEPPKLIVIASSARISQIASAHPVPVRLGGDLLTAQFLALTPFEPTCHTCMPNGLTTRLRALDPFGPTVFFGAFLLFGVQPLLGKFLLPWFGGTPAVWTTCLLFFQGALLAGYAYAHSTISRRAPGDQRRLHTAVLAISLIGMTGCLVFWGSPILPPGRWKPVGTEDPVIRLLSMLAAAIGLPYLILSATGPLLQAWFSQSRPGASPWRLYALSNLGSLLALLAYPLVVEPLITLRVQALLWAALFAVYAFGCWRCAQVGVAVRSPAPASAAQGALDGGIPTDIAPPSAPDGRPSRARYLLWLALAAAPSLLLSASTNQLCQEVSPVPFLWILPLALYLLSFVICFAGDRYYWRWLWHPVLALSSAAAYVMIELGVHATFMAQLLTYPLVLFAAAMVCHGELFRLRPDPSRLTSFYLTIAAGGAIGSAFVALVAPRIFAGYWELHVGLLLACVLAVLVLLADRGSWLYRRAPWPALVAIVIGGSLRILPFDDGLSAVREVGRTWLWDNRVLLAVVIACVPLSWVLRRWRPAAFLKASMVVSSGLLVAALWILQHQLVTSARSASRDLTRVARNFYGVIAVTEHDAADPERHRYLLQHGRIEHGHQLRAPALRCLPASYYTESSGFGLAVLTRPRRASGADRSLHIGMVGLGVGASAALAQAGDTVRFYEINPAVVELSLGASNVFTYLKDCPGHADVVPGDARLSLERELREGKPQQFDVLGIDAFNSDAIPVHLLTTEAIEIYEQHLRRPDGILAIHISNRYLDLQPVVRAAAVARNLDTVIIESRPGSDKDPGANSSTWVLLSPDRDTLRRPEIASVASESDGRTSRLWTDDFSNLLAAVSRKSIVR